MSAMMFHILAVKARNNILLFAFHCTRSVNVFMLCFNMYYINFFFKTNRSDQLPLSILFYVNLLCFTYSVLPLWYHKQYRNYLYCFVIWAEINPFIKIKIKNTLKIVQKQLYIKILEHLWRVDSRHENDEKKFM